MRKERNLKRTPLQRVVGFDVAEEIYDSLPLLAQLILDLKIEGYTDTEISLVLEIPRTTIVDTFQRARHTLLDSKLHLILESRQYYREITPTVMETEQ